MFSKILDWLIKLFTPGVATSKPVDSVSTDPVKPAESVKDEYPAKSSDQILKLAKTKIGQKEVLPNGKVDPFVTECFAHTSYPTKINEPWCAAFICWVLWKLGLKSTNDAGADSFVKFGYDSGLVVNCIVVLQHLTGELKGHFHVTICSKVGDARGFYGVGGNQSNMVCEAYFNYTDWKIVGTRLPNELKPTFNSPTITPTPVPNPVTPDLTAMFLEWCRKAIDISQSFEGSDPWANITGNFDGAYLTCGALGFTWKYNNQPPMIKKFVSVAGEKRAKELMPQFWDIYWKAAQLGENGGAGTVSAWSNGSSNVRSDVKKELQAFWKSPEMVKIQIDTAWQMMGAFAAKKTLEGQKYFGLKDPKFSHYAYWFDQGVLNGQGNTVQFGAEKTVTKQKVIDWCNNATGMYQLTDLKNNAKLWNTKFDLIPPDQQALFLMAYLRAIVSRQQFMPVTMNRRGTVAMGEGLVNGEKRSFEWKA